jgi:3-dehydroquinate synthase
MENKVRRVPVRAGSREYEAVVGAGLLRRASEFLRPLFGDRRCAVICDTNTGRFADEIALAANSTTITVPAGEQSKTIEQVSAICDQMLDAGLDRTSFVIGVGGGVTGDMSGFAAAIFQRGIPHVQVPTTLLAMVDSSIGGKTGVNTRAGKNLLGAIHQPSLIIADVETLNTLPQPEFRQGFAEIIKHGIIRDAEMLTDLLSRAERSGAANHLGALITRNIEIKSAIVAADERDETGERALLNFGHTVGHAIERAAGYGALLHGEAISLGIVAACEVSVAIAGLSEAERDRVVELLARLGLPTRLPPNVPREKIMEAIAFDKKFEHGQVRFVVTPRLGEACLSKDVTLQQIGEAVAKL